MNDDHTDDNLLIVRAFGGDAAARAVSATMIGLDHDGGTWRFARADGEETDVAIAWPSGPISARPEIRREVVVLYRDACARLGLPPREH